MGKRSDFGRIEKEPPKRFTRKVGDADRNGCRLWLGYVDRLGYGQYKFAGTKNVAAHRAAYFFSNGNWPEVVMHMCDVRNCCEPTHLAEGTHAENMKDCAEKKRNRTPRPGNGRRKLSEMDKEKISELFRSGWNKSAISREFGVTPTRIRQLLNG